MPHPISADAEGAHLGRRVLLRGSGRGQKFSFIILLDYSTIGNMCFVCGCVLCVGVFLYVFSVWGCGLVRVGWRGGGGGGNLGALEDSTWGEC